MTLVPDFGVVCCFVMVGCWYPKIGFSGFRVLENICMKYLIGWTQVVHKSFHQFFLIFGHFRWFFKMKGAAAKLWKIIKYGKTFRRVGGIQKPGLLVPPDTISLIVCWHLLALKILLWVEIDMQNQTNKQKRFSIKCFTLAALFDD